MPGESESASLAFRLSHGVVDELVVLPHAGSTNDEAIARL